MLHRERMLGLGAIVLFAMVGGQMVMKMRELAARNAELEAVFGKLDGASVGNPNMLPLASMGGGGGVPTPCPVIPPPTPCPAIPPPTPCPAAVGSPDTPAAAPPPAPVAVAQSGGGDWRLPKGPAPPRPPTMPKWFKWQPKAEEWCIPGPHNRHHSKRIAAIVVNYNMVERANSIAEGIKKHVKWPVDVIVVDNGSDLKESPPSPHTAIRLEANVQTTNGWQMGIEYAKALGHVSDERAAAPRCTNQIRACIRIRSSLTHGSVIADAGVRLLPHGVLGLDHLLRLRRV
jgi:hypothetical protein